MWICKQCNEQNEDSFGNCFQCGTTKIYVGPPENPAESDKMNLGTMYPKITFSAKRINEVDESDDQGYSSEYTSTFDTTRVISQFVAFFGWITMLVCSLIILAAIIGLKDFNLNLFSSVYVGIVIGITCILSGQLTRAIVDNTDNTEKMVSLLKEILNKEYNSHMGRAE